MYSVGEKERKRRCRVWATRTNLQFLFCDIAKYFR